MVSAEKDYIIAYAILNKNKPIIDRGINPKRLAFINIALSQVGKKDSVPYLLDALTPQGKNDVFPDKVDTIEWCGIFALWALRKAGLTNWLWELGKGFLMSLPQTVDPKPGDLGYSDKQHHSIIESIEGDMVHSIDGNSWNGQVQRNSRPRSFYRAFFSIAPLVGEVPVQRETMPEQSPEQSPADELMKILYAEDKALSWINNKLPLVVRLWIVETGQIKQCAELSARIAKLAKRDGLDAHVISEPGHFVVYIISGDGAYRVDATHLQKHFTFGSLREYRLGEIEGLLPEEQEERDKMIALLDELKSNPMKAVEVEYIKFDPQLVRERSYPADAADTFVKSFDDFETGGEEYLRRMRMLDAI